MVIERIPVAELKPAPYNPRVTLRAGDAAWERLRRSLEEFELVQPLVWNRRTGHLVGGHQRLAILRERGETAVECVVVDLPLEREKALNVALNNPEIAGDWDAEKLVDLIDELLALPDVDPTLTGFDEEQLRDILLSPVETEDGNGGCDEPADEFEEESQMVTATLEVPQVRWDAVRSRLDELLAAEPGVRCHVRSG